jgi:hypothetical protein
MFIIYSEIGVNLSKARLSNQFAGGGGGVK